MPPPPPPDVTKPENVVVNFFGGVISDPNFGLVGWQRVVNLCSLGKHRRMHRGTLNVAGTVTVPTGSVSRVHLLAARARTGTLVLRLTTLSAADQGFPLSGGAFAFWRAPASGDEVIEIKIVGTGEVDYMVAGD